MSVWGSIASTVAGAAIAICVSWQNHYLTNKRERMIRDQKEYEELLFIGTELIFSLESYVRACLDIATDYRDIEQDGRTRTTIGTPIISFDDISGNWRVLSASLMYRIRELPFLQNEIESLIHDEADHNSEYAFHVMRCQYAKLAVRGLILSKQLRAEIKKLAQSNKPHDKKARLPDPSYGKNFDVRVWQAWRRAANARRQYRRDLFV